MATRSANQRSLTGTFLDGLIQGEKWDISSNNTISIQMSNYESYFNAIYDTIIPNSSLLYAVLNFVSLDISRYLPINFSVSNSVISDPIYSTADITFTAINMASSDAYYAGLTLNTLGVAEFPGSETSGDIYNQNLGVDVFLNYLLLRDSNLSPGQAGIYTIYHELGHALGLKHPFDDGGNGRPTFQSLGISIYDFGLNTVMSYENPADYSSDGYGAPTSFMALDILALQELYGKRIDFNTEDSIYSLYNTNAWGALYDCGGVDTLDFSACTQGFFIELNGGLSHSNDFQTGYWFLSQNSSVDNLINDLEASYENVVGTNYSDIIYGNTLNNQINGGTGFDTFGFNIISDAVTSIRHLKSGGAVINSSEGTDTLISIENLRFVDGDFTIRELIASIPRPTFSSIDSNGASITVSPSLYTGEVAFLEYELLGSATGDVIIGSSGNDFMNLLGGDDAANGGLGDDVLDGGIGSNFLTGGGGDDTFFLDGRGGTTTWSTITDFNSGDQVNIWGWNAGVSKLIQTQANGGATGYTGATFHYDLDDNGLIDTSITFTGLTVADIPNGVAMSVAGNGYYFIG